MRNAIDRRILLDFLGITLGGIVYALGFDLFLRPNLINCGGLSGLALIVSELTGFQAVGVIVLLCNVPLYLLGWKCLGRHFFLWSLWGMLVPSVMIDVLAFLPGVRTEPILAGLYGGVLTGAGLGLVFLRGASTGGTDLLARLVKRKLRRAPVGKILFAFDCLVVTLTGVVFHNVDKTLYSAVTLFVMSAVLDALIYGCNDSGVAMIISERHQEIADRIEAQLNRGATLLQGTGAYTNAAKTVILCAVPSNQMAQLQKVIWAMDPDAFVIVQKARQVLGKGFGRYSLEGP